MARVEHPARAGGDRGLDGGDVGSGRLRPADRGRHHQHLVGALECRGERRRVGEVAAAHAHPAVGEGGGGPRVGHADPELGGRQPLEQALDDARAEPGRWRR
ncbi:hypothetical protein GCM10025868_30650 [Angustibacter aerolatus]|uniref:Uncharacterized protein n=1 Tax=Angustibacter aerolatus TaxID=1162965 RepID=A0ABQ6JKN2_9ACTN|nr:hypothetical protein [Angustibacter aerolatus]GMA87815.1 hypothetical protein GCM10025868_30650 [Angustibacter aerolatus]